MKKEKNKLFSEMLRINFKSRFFLVFIFLFGLLLRLYNLISQEIIYFDEGAYIQEGAGLIGEVPSMPLFYGRPTYSILIALFRLLTHNQLISGRIVSILGFIIIFITFSSFLEGLFSKEVKTLSLILLSVSPLDIYYSRLIFPDEIASSILCLAVCLVFTQLKENVHKINIFKLVTSGFLFGLFFTIGSYRILPLILVIGIAIIFFLFKKFNRKLFLPLILMICSSIIPIVIMNFKFNFLKQVYSLIKGQPAVSKSNVGLIKFDFLYYPYVFAIFLTPIFILILFYICKNLQKIKFFKISEVESKLIKNQIIILTLLIAFIPSIFHSIFSLRAVKVISPSLPWLMVVGSLIICSISNVLNRKYILVLSSVVLLITSLNLIKDMNNIHSIEFINKVGALEGVILDDKGGAIATVLSQTLNPAKTKLIPPWACLYNQNDCKPDYRIVNIDTLVNLDNKISTNWSPLFSSNRVVFDKFIYLLMRLESADQGKTLFELNPLSFHKFEEQYTLLKSKK
jgi:hypothetical protein